MYASYTQYTQSLEPLGCHLISGNIRPKIEYIEWKISKWGSGSSQTVGYI
jgi:hypothetical protein